MGNLFQILVFLLPVQLGYHFWPEWAYLFGIRVDYLSPTLFLSDLIVLSLLALFAVEILKKNIRFTPKAIFGILGIFVLAALNIFLSQYPYPALTKWIKVLEFFSLGLLVAKTKKFDFKAWIIRPLVLSVIFFSAIGILQVVLGRTTGGLFYFLGERSFDFYTPGIALVNIFGRDFLRAYSTFSHPNSLAGFLGVSLLLISQSGIKSGVEKLAVFLGSACLLLTFSTGAIVGLIIALSLKNLRRIVLVVFWVSIFLSIISPVVSSRFLKVYPDSEPVYRRLVLAEAAGEMISEKPVFGEGLNNFIIQLPKKSSYPSTSWWLQPVHNIYLLVFAETGTIGLLVFVFLLFTALSRTTVTNKTLASLMLFIIVTGTVDHYWLTLQQNQLLLTLVLGLSFRRWKIS